MAFRISLEPSGHTFVAEKGEKVLAAGLGAGFFLPYSCSTGVCGTCKGKIKQGSVDYGHASPAYLTDEDKSNGYALLCEATALSDLVVEVEEISGLAGVTRKVVPGRVAELSRAAQDVIVMRVRIPMNENLRFVAGQHVEFVLKDGNRRSYSIASMPTAEGATELEFHLRHLDGGLFTDHVFSTMKARELVSLDGPCGTFFVREDSDKPIIFIASGTGFAPVKSMLQHVFKTGIHAKRPVHLYWGARTRADLYMLDLVNEWAQQYENFVFEPVLSQPGAQCEWTGRTGYLQDAVAADHSDLSGHQVYACGAPRMVQAARHLFTSSLGLAEKEFFADEFLSERDRAELTHLQPHPEEITP